MITTIAVVMQLERRPQSKMSQVSSSCDQFPSRLFVAVARRLALAAALALILAPRCDAQPVVSAVLNGVTFDASMSPGCWISIFGTGFTETEASALSVPLPTVLAGVRVTIGGIDAPLRYVGPGQINVLIPFELNLAATFQKVALTVTTMEGTSEPFVLVLDHASPGIFTLSGNGLGPAHIYTTGFEAVDTVTEGEFVIIYAACLGVTDPPATTAEGGASQEPFHRPVNEFQVFMGDEPAEAVAVLAPGFPGVFQVNVRPSALSSDRLYLESAGLRSNAVEVNNIPGQNVANVSGSIESFYPPTNPTSQFPAPSIPHSTTAALEIGSFSVEFEILPNAEPFTVVAVGDAGSSIIRIDPTDSTFVADVNLPTDAAKTGVFISTEFNPLWDLFSCTVKLGCSPFANSIVPRSRVDPSVQKALTALLTPNTEILGRSNGILHVEGRVMAGLPFRVDAQNNPDLMRFGGFDLAPFGPFSTATASFKLYVDGVLIDSNETEYEVVAYPVP